MTNDNADYELERAKFADSYIGRMRAFKNQLLIWGVSLNFGLAAVVINYIGDNEKNFLSSFIAVASFLLNFLIASSYSREHEATNDLIDDKQLGRYLSFRDIVKSHSPKTYCYLIAAFILAELFWAVILYRVNMMCCICQAC